MSPQLSTVRPPKMKSRAVRPPRPPAPDFEAIPQEVKSSRRWLCWRYSRRANNRGEFNVIPCGITDRAVNIRDRREWLPFDIVRHQYEWGQYDGIGLLVGDGLVGLYQKERTGKRTGNRFLVLTGRNLHGTPTHIERRENQPAALYHRIQRYTMTEHAA